MNDSESFVRASAFRAIGHLTVYDELLSPLLLALKFTPAVCSSLSLTYHLIVVETPLFLVVGYHSNCLSYCRK